MPQPPGPQVMKAGLRTSEGKASVGASSTFSQGSTFYVLGTSILIVVGTARLRPLNDERSTGVHLLAIGSSAFGWRAST
jgi:hypothetical protein